ncbi:hypothetical protein ABIC33_001249 [Variovorax sp. 1140]|uniref:hypothetical protein n=1 Tax=Variovorax atrisoli TaxID=3394203 RepID=UPI003391153B
MPMDFLRRIEEASFPLVVREQGDIDCAAVLVAANLIEANLPEPGDRLNRPAVILRITPQGRTALARLRRQRA